MRAPFVLADTEVRAGRRGTVRVPISLLADHTMMGLTAHIVHGARDGPTVFVSGAIHGDEIIGVGIVRELVERSELDGLSGTLILIPVVNGYGFIGQSRYLPDRRDLNRSFPGSETGSLAGQLAHAFMTRIVARCDVGIDLHSGAVHRENLPQIRANLEQGQVKALAAAFGAPVTLDAKLRDGSLRQAAQEEGCDILLYEAGEALRFDPAAIAVGVSGILRVLGHLGMISPPAEITARAEMLWSSSSHWLRAPIGGVMRARVALGEMVEKGQCLAEVSDPLGEMSEAVTARGSGIIIGCTHLPIVHRGDALFHVARIDGDLAPEEGDGEGTEADALVDSAGGD